MAHSSQAIKRVRQTERRYMLNAGRRSATRTMIKKVRHFISIGNKEAAQHALREASGSVDRLASGSRRLMHPNKAARLKSRLSKQVKAMRQQSNTK